MPPQCDPPGASPAMTEARWRLEAAARTMVAARGAVTWREVAASSPETSSSSQAAGGEATEAAAVTSQCAGATTIANSVSAPLWVTGARHQASTWADALDNTSPDILDLDDHQDLEGVRHPAPQPVGGGQLEQQQQGEDHPEPHPTCTNPWSQLLTTITTMENGRKSHSIRSHPYLSRT